MKRARDRTLAKRLLLLLPLCALCVVFMELLFFRATDPGRYDRTVAPVHALYERIHSLPQAIQSGLQALPGRLSALWERREEGNADSPELSQPSQIASRPAIQTEIAWADPAITELVREDDQEFLTGGNLRLPYFNQADDVWAEQLFGRDPIGRYGCGPTALSMAVSALTGEIVNPADMAAWAAGQGYAAPRQGSNLSIVEGTARHYNLRCDSLGACDVETLYEQLSTGGVIVALMGPGHFTSGGHFILLHGVTLTGDILVADPNSRDNSLMTWEARLILDELSSNRGSGAPLWLVSQTEEL